MKLSIIPKIDFNECFVPVFQLENEISWRFSVDVYGFSCSTFTVATKNKQQTFQNNIVDVLDKNSCMDYYTNGYGYSFIELTVLMNKSKTYNLCPRFSFTKKKRYWKMDSYNGNTIETEWENQFPVDRISEGLVNVSLNNFIMEYAIEEMCDLGENFQYILNSCDLVNRSQFEKLMKNISSNKTIT